MRGWVADVVCVGPSRRDAASRWFNTTGSRCCRRAYELGPDWYTACHRSSPWARIL